MAPDTIELAELLPTRAPGPAAGQRAALRARSAGGSSRACASAHGDVFTVSFPDFRKVVYLAGPSLVRELFTGDPGQLHAGEANATILEPAVGPRSVLTLDDDEHMRQRKLLLPPFHGKAVDATARSSARLRSATSRPWPVGEPFGIRPHTQAITLDVILRAVYGLDDPVRFRRAHQVVDAFASAATR
jgi:cytochrome P450